jgi:hypothetical protein
MSNIDLGKTPKNGGASPTEAQKKDITAGLQAWKSPVALGPISNSSYFSSFLGCTFAYSNPLGSKIAAYTNDVYFGDPTWTLDLNGEDYQGYANLSGYKNLDEVLLQGNDLSSVKLDDCTSLNTVYVQNNPNLSELSFDNCSSLNTIYAYNCALTEMQFDGSQQSLTDLNTYSNYITGTLDLLKLPSLIYAYVGQNYYTKLAAKNHPSLRELDIANTKLTAVDVSGCTELEWLWCNFNTETNYYQTNNLQTINASGCTELRHFVAFNNLNLKSINVDGCTAMNTFNVSNCPSLLTIDLRPVLNGDLSQIYVNDCGFKTQVIDKLLLDLADGPIHINGIVNVSGNEPPSDSPAVVSAINYLNGLGWTITA